jgi:hypothetical protein
MATEQEAWAAWIRRERMIGAREERQRIIKLLEEHGVALVEENWEDNQAVNGAYINLIKGATK